MACLDSSHNRATADAILDDYLKAVPLLTIIAQNKLQKQMEQVVEESRNSDVRIKSELYEKGLAIANLTIEIH